MTVLGIDSSSKSAGASIVQDGKILSEFFINNKLTHSTTLLPMVDDALKIAGLSFGDIDLVAVTSGPGSFTGVRIGITTAKGLCATRNIKCMGISSLEAIAYNCVTVKGTVCAMMDARLGQVYNAVFYSDGKKLTRKCEDRAICARDLKNELLTEGDVYLTGDGAPVHYEEFLKNHNFHLMPAQNIFIKASSVALLAAEKYKDGENYDAATLCPQYLRLPQAERELQNKGR